jgi:hypothetical protein
MIANRYTYGRFELDMTTRLSLKSAKRRLETRMLGLKTPRDQENRFVRRNLPGVGFWRAGLVLRCFYRGHPAKISGGAALGEVGLWRSAGAVCCRAGHAKNDEDAIRAAAKAVPDLQAPGGGGATLLYLAVTQSWRRPELAEAVGTLLSLGADPNYTNGNRNSFAMANAVHASARDAGGGWQSERS